MARRNGTAALDETRKALAGTDAEIVALRQRRADELRGAADSAALDKLDDSIRALEIVAGRHRERVTLLEAEAERERIERQAKEKASLIERIEARLAKR